MAEVFYQQRSETIEALNAFMTEYLNSTDKVALYRRYESYLKQVNPIDLFLVQMFSNQTDQSIETIKAYANRFVNLFFHGLTAYSWNRHTHPVLEMLITENERITAHLNQLKTYLDASTLEQSVEKIKASLEVLVAIDKKFIKSQNSLFPLLERRVPSVTPFKVLWSVQDDVLSDRLRAIRLLEETPIDWKTFKVAIGEFYYGLAGIIQKEDLIVFPLAADYLTQEDFDSMIPTLKDIGFTLMATPSFPNEPTTLFQDTILKTSTGTLSLDQFILVMNHLPIEITYVDETDKVRYFNQPTNRHFPRTSQVLNREVRYCHPPKSVHVVEQILEAFKQGLKDQAQFWMSFKGMKLLITYYAIHNEKGDYKGVLEVTQDITEMTKLEGEKRLLDWE